MSAERGFVGRLVPVLVVVWVSFAVLGGAVHAVSGGDSAQEVAQAGLGLCMATTAFVFSFGLEGLGRVGLPENRGRLLAPGLPRLRLRPLVALRAVLRSRTPASLQVFRI